jgi:CRP-like cAMP-binding protein
MSEAVVKKIDAFFGQFRVRKYSKGQILILNDDKARYVYHMISGRVKQYDITYRGDEVILNVFKPPAFFPMSLAINKTENPYIYEADTDIEVHEVPAEEAVQFLKDNPDVTFDLLSRVYRGVDGLVGRVAHLMASSARSRLMYEVLIECRRFGKTNKKGGCTIELNETELGARAGLSRETVSREIRKLSDDELLSLKARTITVHDLKAFESKLNRPI